MSYLLSESVLSIKKQRTFLLKLLLLVFLLVGTIALSSARTTQASTLDAEFVSQNVPTHMFPGVAYNVSVTMKNTGTSAWIGAGWPGGPTSTILSALPLNDTTWGRTSDGLSDDDFIANGDTKEFTMIVIAPTTLGTYDFEWQMSENGVVFGDASTKIEIDVDYTP